MVPKVLPEMETLKAKLERGALGVKGGCQGVLGGQEGLLVNFTGRFDGSSDDL